MGAFWSPLTMVANFTLQVYTFAAQEINQHHFNVAFAIIILRFILEKVGDSDLLSSKSRTSNLAFILLFSFFLSFLLIFFYYFIFFIFFFLWPPFSLRPVFNQYSSIGISCNLSELIFKTQRKYSTQQPSLITQNKLKSRPTPHTHIWNASKKNKGQ